MTILRNPYVAGNPVGNSPAFIGREGVLRDVLRVLRRPQDNAIVLYGQRRIGKTSILQHLASRLPEEGPYRPVYLDLQDKAAWPLGRLLQDMARVIAHALGQPEPDLGPDPESAFRDEWLPATLQALPKDTAVVLLLDEFDVLSDPKAEQAAAAFFPYLRELLACDPDRLQFEFVIGRNVDDLSNIALSVFKGTPARHISLLSQEDSAHLVRLSEANNSLRWPDEAVQRVWEWAHGHPFLTQQLCSHVWERAYDEAPLHEAPDEPPAVTPSEVDAAVPEALDASKNTMEWLWDGLPPAARVVASALAEAGAEAISPEALERLLYDSGVRVVIRELQSAPQLLQGWDLIEPADGGYRFRVELLRRWIADNKPLRRVQEELDHIEPVAENLHQAAQALYQSGQLEQAASLLRQAVALNPSHVRANQLLADILLAQGNADEAARLLGQLYEYQPAAARPRLVQVLLTQAREAGTEDDRLDTYERVLTLDPAQPEAVAEKRRIWVRRGDAALEAGDLDAALEAYQTGDATGKVAKTWEQRGDTALKAGDLETALEAYQTGGFADKADEVVAEIDRQTHLKDLYQRALGALQSDDRQTAQTLLAQVVALEPGYEEATRYLHLAVTGNDPREPSGLLVSAKYIPRRLRAWVRRALANPVSRRRLTILGLVILTLAAILTAFVQFQLRQYVTAGVAFSPDGAVLASVFRPGFGTDQVILWDVHEGRQLRTLRPPFWEVLGPWHLAFSPDGSKVAVADWNSEITYLWDANSGDLLRSLTGALMTFSPDGTILASRSQGTVILWDAVTGERLRTLKETVRVAFSPDGMTLASDSEDHEVILWNVETGERLHTLAGGGLQDLAFSPDGTMLASASGDHEAILWNVETGERLHTLDGLNRLLGDLDFSPDGTMLAAACGGSVILWDVETGERLPALVGHTERQNLVKFSPDGKTLLALENVQASLWDLETGVQLHTLKCGSNVGTVFSPDGTTLACGGHEGVPLLDVITGELVLTLKPLVLLP